MYIFLKLLYIIIIMKKLGIIVDSFSGLTQEQANEKGYSFLPLRIEIDGVFYEDGKEIDSQDLLKKLTTEAKVKTSLPNYNLIVQTIEETSNEYDDVIYLGVSKELSNTFSQFISVASEKNNVYAMENHLFGNQIIRVVEYFKKLYENGASINELYSKLNDINETSRTFIVPKNLQFIVNGGRLSGLKKFILSYLKMFPILSYDLEGKVKSISIKKTFKQAVYKAFDLVNDFIEEIKSYNKEVNVYVDLVAGIDNEVNNFITSDEFIKPTSKINTPASIAAHTGPEAFAVSVMLELDK